MNYKTNRLDGRMKTRIVYAAFALVMLAYFMLMPFPLGDDISFVSDVSGDVREWLAFRYNNWSSRVIIEALLAFFCRVPSIICRVFSAGLAALCAYLLQRLFAKRGARGALLACSLFLVFAAYDADVTDKYFSLLASTGFMATVMNYLLPATLALAALLPIKYHSEKRAITPALWAASGLAALVACNQEQVCAVLLAAYAVCGVYYARRKNFHPVFAMQGALALFSLIFILTCPGNASRLAQETVSWNPRFAVMSLFDKIDVGISCTLKLFFEPPVILLVFTALIALVVFYKYESALFRALAAFPLAVALAFGPLARLTDSLFGNIALAFGASPFESGWLNLTGTPALGSIIMFVIGCADVVCVFVGIYLAFGHNARSLVMSFVLLLGLATRAVMGFSPTVAVSGARTAFFLLLAALAVCLALFDELERAAGMRKRDSAAAAVAGAALFSYAVMLLPLLGI